MTKTQAIVMIVCIAFATCYNVYTNYISRKFETLLTITLKEKGYDTFCTMLNSKKAKFVYKRYTIDLKRLDAAMYLDLHSEVESLIKKLNNVPMSKKDFINYNMVVLNYAASCHNKELGTTARDALHRRGISKQISLEADQVYDIYVIGSSNHIDELRIFAAKIKNPSSKAMAYYRIARQYYNLNDTANFKKYIALAKVSFNNPVWVNSMELLQNGDYSELK